MSAHTDSLRAAFSAVAGRTATLSPTDLSAIHERVCDVVDELKASGALPERVIVVVRRIAQDSGVTLSGDHLLEQVVMWCVDCYYAKDLPS